MYTDQFCNDSSCFSSYAAAFGLFFINTNDRAVARTTTLSGINHRLTGYGTNLSTLLLDPSITGTGNGTVSDITVSTINPDLNVNILRGFMFYKFVETPEPSMMGLLGLGFTSLALLSYRQSRRK